MKKIIAIILSCLMLTACSSAEVEQELPNGYYKYDNCTLIILDEINMLSDTEESTIVKQLSPYCEKLNCDVMLRIISVNEEPYLISSDNSAQYFPDDTQNSLTVTYNALEKTLKYKTKGDKMDDWLPRVDALNMLNAGDQHFKTRNYPRALGATLEYGLKIIIKNGGSI